MKVVVLAAAAYADLAAIGDFIGRDNPVRAASFVDELLDKCERLADAPEAFPVVARYKTQKVRRRAFRDYLIFYRVGLAEIEILHILHGARSYENLLFPEA